jgi:hypothetical protein
MIWKDFFAAYENWDDDARARYLPAADELAGASPDEIFEAFDYIGNENLCAALLKNAMAAGIRFQTGQVTEMVQYLPREIANELFLLYAGQMTHDDFCTTDGSVDEDVFSRALMAWAMSGKPVTWQEYYEQGTNLDYSDEIKIVRLRHLVSFGKADEVYDFGAFYFCDDGQRSIFVDKAIAAGIRFDFDQTVELMNGVNRETANRLYWAYGKKLSPDDLDEIEGLVDDEVFTAAQKGAFFSNAPIDWEDFIENMDEWDDDVKLHKASHLTSFAGADDVAEVAESFLNRDMAARFVEIAIHAGVEFPAQSRKAGFFEGLLQVAGAIAIADWIFGNDKPKRQGGAMGGGIGVDRPDVFGSDYSSIFDDVDARDEYYRRMRQERYEDGRAADEFEPIE